jgi:hypothetical protein
MDVSREFRCNDTVCGYSDCESLGTPRRDGRSSRFLFGWASGFVYVIATRAQPINRKSIDEKNAKDVGRVASGDNAGLTILRLKRK